MIFWEDLYLKDGKRFGKEYDKTGNYKMCHNGDDYLWGFINIQ